ncbi:hypothetical protein M409DRAFT_29624 [Zasmidium cellare ATCC 36951]|uniref:Uncharacterized protein n=1 Tax=Zasmidium cellare ATCC 36951 TaxID=1080233 RepID=A0A6A6BYZ0_ZASCE|nr:uncharacterized protein M409DRAFT_29624 [Zasmidium cellare ATCC 36951]KAF2160017.1 hypothetical protein M409DRAFT_29624 [Zasmidium cellare ATCC 36951]
MATLAALASVAWINIKNLFTAEPAKEELNKDDHFHCHINPHKSEPKHGNKEEDTPTWSDFWQSLEQSQHGRREPETRWKMTEMEEKLRKEEARKAKTRRLAGRRAERGV